jgi:rare lipoprotein A
MRKSIYRSFSIILIILFCLAQLSGCSFLSKPTHRDGAPALDFDASKIPDAVPKNEPLNPSCNHSYTFRGHRYYVLKSAVGYHQRGVASWYGVKFHKHRTSTGERYNLYAMSAASTTLPLPTYVKVTNLANGKHVIVKVNDRGPFRHKRILDVSYAAAKKLGFANKGTARVDVLAITFGNPKYRHSHFASNHRHRRTI